MTAQNKVCTPWEFLKERKLPEMGKHPGPQTHQQHPAHGGAESFAKQPLPDVLNHQGRRKEFWGFFTQAMGCLVWFCVS